MQPIKSFYNFQFHFSQNTFDAIEIYCFEFRFIYSFSFYSQNFFKWAILGFFFLYFCLFNTVDCKQMFNINFEDDWIRTTDLWCRKQPLYQLSHNHYPKLIQNLFYNFCSN